MDKIELNKWEFPGAFPLIRYVSSVNNRIGRSKSRVLAQALPGPLLKMEDELSAPVLGLQLTDTQQNSTIYVPVREGMPVGGSVSGEHT